MMAPPSPQRRGSRKLFGRKERLLVDLMARLERMDKQDRRVQQALNLVEFEHARPISVLVKFGEQDKKGVVTGANTVHTVADAVRLALRIRGVDVTGFVDLCVLYRGRALDSMAMPLSWFGHGAQFTVLL